jgi:phytoene synthase
MMQVPDAPESVLSRHGRTFAWASRFLPGAVRRDCARLYAACRAVDDIADRPVPGASEDPATRLAAIRRDLGWEGAVEPAATFNALAHERGLDLDAARLLVQGVGRDLGEVRIGDEAELIGYAHAVAGTVGLMMCDVLGVENRAARPHAAALGIAMQLTNIARDVDEDARLGRRYLPATWIDASPAALATPSAGTREAGRQAVARLLSRAEAFYDSGLAGLDYLPAPVRPGIAVAATLYRGIGHALDRRGCAFWNGRVRLTPARKALLVAQALGGLAVRRRAGPLSDAEGACHAAE